MGLWDIILRNLYRDLEVLKVEIGHTHTACLLAVDRENNTGIVQTDLWDMFRRHEHVVEAASNATKACLRAARARRIEKVIKIRCLQAVGDNLHHRGVLDCIKSREQSIRDMEEYGGITREVAMTIQGRVDRWAQRRGWRVRFKGETEPHEVQEVDEYTKLREEAEDEEDDFSYITSGTPA